MPFFLGFYSIPTSRACWDINPFRICRFYHSIANFTTFIMFLFENEPFFSFCCFSTKEAMERIICLHGLIGKKDI